jgi:hypothetical protein
MQLSLINLFKRLRLYIEREDFAGWDPYDGLSSRVFNATPLKYSAFARLAWIQLFKRNPVNLRRLMMVSKGQNPKAIGLFLSGYSRLYKFAESGNIKDFDIEYAKLQLVNLSSLLMKLQSKGYSGACWGYNFDWQARGGLFFPAYTPTVVATTYAVNGLLDAYEITNCNETLETALSAANFVLNDLNRTPKKQGFLFSYSPKFGNNTVYNASLLGSRLLSRIHSFTPNDLYFEASRESVIACCDAQKSDGSWYYGELSVQNWIDSFHTGFNLECLYDYSKYTGDTSFHRHFQLGTEYYLSNFFESDGLPKYYHDRAFPVDIHSPAQLILFLSKTGLYTNYAEQLEKVLEWTIANMYDEGGYFYYQKHKLYTNKINYMRWSQAWMFAALSYYLTRES